MNMCRWLGCLIVLCCVVQCQGMTNDDTCAEPVKGPAVWADFDPAIETCLSVARQYELNDVPLMLVIYRLRNAANLYSDSNLDSDSKGAVIDLSGMACIGLDNYNVLIFFLLIEFNKLWHITTLKLSGFQLASLPEEIKEFTHLVSLDISDNHLTELSLGLNALVLLQSLYVNNNQITSFPLRFCFSHSHLKELDISYNQLIALPDDIDQLDSLVVLKVSNNKLIAIPALLKEIKWLRHLYVDGNALGEASGDIFPFLTQNGCIVRGAQAQRI